MRIGVSALPARPRLLVAACAVAAALLVLASMWLPLWRMQLAAPQYPEGLEIVAYGDRIEGDVAEINIVNHYIGMATIEADAIPEMRLYPLGMRLLAALCVLALVARWLLRLVFLVAAGLPLVILADLQWWLYRFGHDFDPTAPLRFVEPFTPPVIGISTIGNFRSINTVSSGFLLLLVAAALLYGALRWWPRRTAEEEVSPVRLVSARAATLLMVGSVALLGMPSPGAEAAGEVAREPVAGLQARIDAAPPGSRIEVVGGHYLGTLHLRGPLVVEGVGGPVLDGGGRGSVVTIDGDAVVLRGFVVRNGGRDVSAEAAGIKVRGSRHRIEDNRIEDVYFGAHLADGEGNVVRRNVIEPAKTTAERPGHAISLWYQRRALVEGNRIAGARDGIYLSFSEDVRVAGNRVTGSRYGIHSMYVERSSFVGNEIAANLVGAALMYSQGLEIMCNRIERHREGATAYAILLKDVADLRIEGNLLAGNRVAIYADNTPLSPGSEAMVAGNRIVGNDAALALQSTARLTFVGNAVVNNLTTVRLEGRRAADGNVWSRGGRGNHWDDYLGFDRDGDGIGDVAYRSVVVLPRLARADEPARALLWTPAHHLVEASARLFPVVRPVALIDDATPLVEPPPLACPEERR